MIMVRNLTFKEKAKKVVAFIGLAWILISAIAFNVLMWIAVINY